MEIKNVTALKTLLVPGVLLTLVQAVGLGGPPPHLGKTRMVSAANFVRGYSRITLVDGNRNQTYLDMPRAEEFKPTANGFIICTSVNEFEFRLALGEAR